MNLPASFLLQIVLFILTITSYVYIFKTSIVIPRYKRSQLLPHVFYQYIPNYNTSCAIFVPKWNSTISSGNPPQSISPEEDLAQFPSCYLDVAKFTSFLSYIGGTRYLSRRNILDIFNQLDVNGDGQLRWTEMSIIANDYPLSTNSSGTFDSGARNGQFSLERALDQTSLDHQNSFATK